MYYTILYNCKSSDRYVSDREDSQISEALNCLSTMMNIVREHKNPMFSLFFFVIHMSNFNKLIALPFSWNISQRILNWHMCMFLFYLCNFSSLFE